MKSLLSLLLLLIATTENSKLAIDNTKTITGIVFVMS